MDGHPDRARLVGKRARDGLTDPPRGVGGELEATAIVELLGSSNEPDRSFLDQVEERQALISVALRDRDDEPEVRLDHRLLGGVVGALDPLRELDLLRRGQERDAPDVLEEELERVGRDLTGFRLLPCGDLGLDLLDPVDHLDLELLERRVELVELAGVWIELVKGSADVVGAQLSRRASALQEQPALVRLQQIGDLWSGILGDSQCAHGSPSDQALPDPATRSLRPRSLRPE